MKHTKSALILIIAMLLVSCLHRGSIKQEKGVVVEKQYKPELNADGLSYNTSGELGYHTLHEDQKFIIVFKCEHGVVFSVNRDFVYAKVSKGDSVIIQYNELLDDKERVRDYSFIDVAAYNTIDTIR